MLSGVNRGQNIAEDVTYSGTVAGAMEGTVLGIPSLALSQAYAAATRAIAHWDTAAKHAPDLIRRVLDEGMPRDVLVNVNFPDCAPDEVEGHRDHDAGQARPGASAHRAAPRRARQSVLLDRVRAQPAAVRAQRHRSAGDRRQAHLGDAAAPRHDRRAVHDAARGDFRIARDFALDHVICVARRKEVTLCGDGLPRSGRIRAPLQDFRRVIREALLVSPSREPHIGRMEFLLDLRRRGISDANVLRAMDEVPREQFVMPNQAASAYADRALPIACGQTISQPYVVAYMTEQLASGAAAQACSRSAPAPATRRRCSSRLVRKVTTIERYRTLATRRGRGSRRSAMTMSTVLVGDGLEGAPEHAPFDRIIVTAAAEEIPAALVEQLAVGGIMVLPLGPHHGSQMLVRLTRTEAGVAREDLIGVRFVPLLPGQAREL